MKTIHKYSVPINGGQPSTVPVPPGAKPLSFQLQGEYALCFWALVNATGETVMAECLVIGTGWGMPDGWDETHFVGTVQFENGLVYHGFMKVPA